MHTKDMIFDLSQLALLVFLTILSPTVYRADLGKHGTGTRTVV